LCRAALADVRTIRLETMAPPKRKIDASQIRLSRAAGKTVSAGERPIS
jgi:hypothetical protein